MILRIFIFFVIVFVAFAIHAQHVFDTPVNHSDKLQGLVSDYYSTNINLKRRADEIVSHMSDEELAGQVLMPSWEKNTSQETLQRWLCNYHLNGFMILRKDIDTQTIADIKTYYKKHCANDLPLFISIDAEPSLIHWGYRLLELKGISQTAQLRSTHAVKKDARKIHQHLQKLGVNMNFAPVVDSNKNKTIISDRSFGGTSKNIRTFADAFVQNAIKNNIIPTLKHFPGHGSAVGDTHKTLESIPGNLPELDNFKPLGDWQAPLIMAGHLVIKGGTYDTNGLPATLSKRALYDLLRKELHFTGVIITDSMGMGAVTRFHNREVKALKAGVDIVLMPKNVTEAYTDILKEIKNNPEFKKQIVSSVKRIVRLKIVQKWAQANHR